jgi:hypothetical protein
VFRIASTVFLASPASDCYQNIAAEASRKPPRNKPPASFPLRSNFFAPSPALRERAQF